MQKSYFDNDINCDVGGVSVSASDPSYKIEVKNKFHSKHHRDHKWGVQYLNDEDAPSTWKDVREFPFVEGYYSFDQSSSTHKVKQCYRQSRLISFIS